jgi:hypothetical protein
VRQNPQNRSLLTVVSAIPAPPFQPLRHQRNFGHPGVDCFTRQTLPTVNTKNVFMTKLYIESFYPQKTHNNPAFRYHTPQAPSPFWLLNPSSEHAHARLLPRPSWSWTVLLPSNTHRKPITSIAVVFLPFVAYLLTLPRFSMGVWDLHHEASALAEESEYVSICIWSRGHCSNHRRICES